MCLAIAMMRNLPTRLGRLRFRLVSNRVITMLRRLKSLVLILVLAGGALGATPLGQSKHGCKMAQMDMGEMSCCKMAEMMHCAAPEVIEASMCCALKTPEQPIPTRTTFNLRPSSVAPAHPAVLQSMLTLPKSPDRPYSARIFLPNLQDIYIHNLSLLN